MKRVGKMRLITKMATAAAAWRAGAATRYLFLALFLLHIPLAAATAAAG